MPKGNKKPAGLSRGGSWRQFGYLSELMLNLPFRFVKKNYVPVPTIPISLNRSSIASKAMCSMPGTLGLSFFA